MSENTKPYTYTKAPNMRLREISSVGTMTIAIEGEDVVIECTISISSKDAAKIKKVFHTWRQAVVSLDEQGEIDPC